MKRNTTVFLLLLPFLLLTGLVLVSVWNVALQSLGYIPAFGLTKPTLQYYIQVFSRGDFLSAVCVSVKIALWSTVFATALGVLLAMALIKCRKTRGAMVYAIRMPILVPHAVVAVFVIQILSQTGLAARFAYMLGLLEDSAQFPQLLFTPSYLAPFWLICGRKRPLWPILYWLL